MNGSFPNRHAQSGAVLIIGVILMLAATMTTLASIRGNLVQERMAANQDLQAQALMAAERGATRFATWLKGEAEAHGWPADEAQRNGWGAADISTCPADMRSEAGIVSCVSIEAGAVSWDAATVRADIVGRVISPAGVLGEHVIRLRAEGLSTELPRPASQAAYTCFGSNCNFRFRGAPIKISGKDHPVSGGEFDCNGGGCNYKADEWAEDTAGISMPNRPTGGVADDVGQVEGSPKVLRAAGGANDTMGDWLSYLNTLTNAVTPALIGPRDGLPSSGRDAPTVSQVVGDVRLNGSADSAGVIIVGDGASLSFSGTFHHEGLIIVMPGGRLNFSAGTAWIYGGIVDMSGSGPSHLADLRGTVNIRYSAEAINNLSKLAPPTEVVIRGWQGQS